MSADPSASSPEPSLGTTARASEAPSSLETYSAPLPQSRMVEFATDACDTTFEKVESYDHPQTAAWNTSIINKVLQALISATSTTTPHKFAVTSTIIEHTTPTPSPPPPEAPLIDNDNPPAQSSEVHPRENKIARRGMHSATGAYWDNTKDGCWSFKYEKGEAKGFDVVVSVIWISIE